MPQHHLPPTTASILGAGRLAWSLVPALQEGGVEVVEIMARSAEKGHRFEAEYGISYNENGEAVPRGEWVILAVSDSAIAPLANLLSQKLAPSQCLVHCSGAVPLSVLQAHPRHGVLYPMQAFSWQRVSWSQPEIPVFVEGSDEELQANLKEFALLLGSHVHVCNSADRLTLHLGAVFVSNFSNLMFQVAEGLVGDLGFQIYEPLIRQQVETALAIGARAAQTGPALRDDHVTMALHLERLAAHPALADLYRRLSAIIHQMK